MWIDVAQTVFDGLMVGGLYATVAVGITLVFGIMGILNFAHGQMVMLGAYIAFFAVTAEVKAPLTWPKSVDSSSSDGTAPVLTGTNGRSRRGELA